jgi:hypothetical protein
MRDFKFQTTFSSIVKPISSAEKDKYLAVASLEQLRAFVPNIDFEKNCDLLGIAFNSCVANRANLNDDAIDTETALAIADYFIHKQVNIEHNRAAVVGTVVSVGFSEFGTDKPLTREELKGSTKPFNITLGAVIWRVVSGDLADIVEASNDPTSDHYMKVSASWELGFDDYDLLVLPKNEKNIEAGKRITDKQQIELLASKLRAYGGEGILGKGERLYRIVKGDVLPLGIGLTSNPAADVKGVAVPKKEMKCKQCDSKMEEDSEDMLCAACKKRAATKANEETLKLINENVGRKSLTFQEILELSQSSQSTKSSVSNNTIIMDKKITSLKDITDEALKEIKAASIHEFVQSELQKACEEHQSKIKAAEEAATKAEDARKDIATAQEELRKKVDELTEKLAEITKQQEIKAKEEKFSARMSAFDEKYNLTADDRKAIAAQIKDLSDEAFAEYEKQAEVLLSSKVKTAKQEEATASATATATTTTTATTSTTEAAQEVVDTALDNANKEATLPNTSSAAEQSFMDKYRKAFAEDQFEIVDRKKRK